MAQVNPSTIRKLLGDLTITTVAGGLFLYAMEYHHDPQGLAAPKAEIRASTKLQEAPSNTPHSPARQSMSEMDKIIAIDRDGRGPVDIHATIDYNYMPTGYDTDGPPEVHINGIYGAGDNLMQYIPQDVVENLEQDILEHEQDCRID